MLCQETRRLCESRTVHIIFPKPDLSLRWINARSVSFVVGLLPPACRTYRMKKIAESDQRVLGFAICPVVTTRQEMNARQLRLVKQVFAAKVPLAFETGKTM